MKTKNKKYTLHVKRDVLFEAEIKAESIEQALEKARVKGSDGLWSVPGEIIDDEYRITAVFE